VRSLESRIASAAKLKAHEKSARTVRDPWRLLQMAHISEALAWPVGTAGTRSASRLMIRSMSLRAARVAQCVIVLRRSRPDLARLSITRKFFGIVSEIQRHKV
jgi:hypothetical protein